MTKCEDKFPDMSSLSSSGNYRYFNQPIEQVPGWDVAKAQILFHGENRGLYWQTIPDCVNVLECLTVVPSGSGHILHGQETIIRPLQILDPPSSPYCEIPLEEIDVVTCVVLNDYGLEIQRKKITVLKTREPDSICENIPVTDCATSPSPP